MTYPDGGVVNYTYTNRDQPFTEALDTSAPFVTYGYDYDNANRLLSITHQNGGGIFSSFAYGYNSVNNRKFVQRENGKGDVYGYDSIDQVTGTQYEATDPSGIPSNPASVESLTYDDAGNRMTQNSTSYSTNDLNQYTSVGSVSPSYDSNGNLIGGLSSGWNYQYDAKNRLVAATSSGSDSLTVAYDGRNRPVKRTMGNTVLPTSAVSRKTHDVAGVFDIDLPLTGTPGIECRKGGATGDHQLVVTFARSISFVAASVFTGTGSIASTSLSGDAKEVTVNLTGVSNAQTIVVKLSGVSDGTVTNDVLVGMSVLLGDTNGNGAVNSTDIAQTQQQTGQTITSANFREDVTANGAINSSDVATVQQQSGTAITTATPITQPQPTTYLIYDGWNLITEFDGNGTQVAKYMNGARTDEVIERVGAPANVYYHHDAVGSTMKLTSSAGAVVEQCAYDVFGSPKIKNASGMVLSASVYGNRFLFTGRELLNIGLYDYRRRIYSPIWGRFLQTDPMRFNAGDVNLYRYVRNSPDNANDPSGEQFVVDWWVEFLKRVIAPLISNKTAVETGLGGVSTPGTDFQLVDQTDLCEDGACVRYCQYEAILPHRSDELETIEYASMHIECSEDCPAHPSGFGVATWTIKDLR
jgi:RHS repeat-associated protein